MSSDLWASCVATSVSGNAVCCLGLGICCAIFVLGKTCNQTEMANAVIPWLRWQTTASPQKDSAQQLPQTDMANASVRNNYMAKNSMTTEWPGRHAGTQPHKRTGAHAQRHMQRTSTKAHRHTCPQAPARQPSVLRFSSAAPLPRKRLTLHGISPQRLPRIA